MTEFHVIPAKTWERQVERLLKLSALPYSKGSTAIHELVFRVGEKYEFPLMAALKSFDLVDVVALEKHPDKTFTNTATEIPKLLL